MKKAYSALMLTCVSVVCFSNIGANDRLPTIQVETQGSSIDWIGASGRTYFVEWSTDLKNWEYFPIIYSGNSSELSHGFNTTATEFFVRLKWTDTPDGGDPNLADFDGDGWGSLYELQVLGTDPLVRDTDGDGSPDGSESFDGDNFSDLWEINYFGNVTTLTESDHSGDIDNDGLSNLQESQLGLNPSNPDHDGDGMLDGYEVTGGRSFDPNYPDNPEVLLNVFPSR